MEQVPKKVEAEIQKVENGKISEEQVRSTINKYRGSQVNFAQILTDATSIGVAGFTFFELNKLLKLFSYFFDEYVPQCDRWILADNSEPPFTIIAEGNHNMAHIKDCRKYEHIWKMSHPEESE